MQELLDFCKENNIKSGSFHGIGACGHAELGFYRVKTKNYTTKEFKGDHEITTLIGTISDKKIHAHATIAAENTHVHGGHVNKMIISATCEIHLIAGKETLNRKMDDEVGLELLDI